MKQGVKIKKGQHTEAQAVGYEPKEVSVWDAIPHNVQDALDEARRGEIYVSLYSGPTLTL